MTAILSIKTSEVSCCVTLWLQADLKKIKIPVVWFSPAPATKKNYYSDFNKADSSP